MSRYLDETYARYSTLKLLNILWFLDVEHASPDYITTRSIGNYVQWFISHRENR